MSHPTTLTELVTYLELNPRVRVTSSSDKVPTGEREFVRYEPGFMWFRDRAGEESHIPIGCGHTGSETGLLIGSKGFTFTKFGVDMRFEFVLSHGTRTPANRKRFTLNQIDYRHLINGGILSFLTDPETDTGIQICLADIGFHAMDGEVHAAQKHADSLGHRALLSRVRAVLPGNSPSPQSPPESEVA